MVDLRNSLKLLLKRPTTVCNANPGQGLWGSIILRGFWSFPGTSIPHPPRPSFLSKAGIQKPSPIHSQRYCTYCLPRQALLDVLIAMLPQRPLSGPRWLFVQVMKKVTVAVGEHWLLTTCLVSTFCFGRRSFVYSPSCGSPSWCRCLEGSRGGETDNPEEESPDRCVTSTP